MQSFEVGLDDFELCEWDTRNLEGDARPASAAVTHIRRGRQQSEHALRSRCGILRTLICESIAVIISDRTFCSRPPWCPPGRPANKSHHEPPSHIIDSVQVSSIVAYSKKKTSFIPQRHERASQPESGLNSACSPLDAHRLLALFAPQAPSPVPATPRGHRLPDGHRSLPSTPRERPRSAAPSPRHPSALSPHRGRSPPAGPSGRRGGFFSVPTTPQATPRGDHGFRQEPPSRGGPGAARGAAAGAALAARGGARKQQPGRAALRSHSPQAVRSAPHESPPWSPPGAATPRRRSVPRARSPLSGRSAAAADGHHRSPATEGGETPPAGPGTPAARSRSPSPSASSLSNPPSAPRTSGTAAAAQLPPHALPPGSLSPPLPAFCFTSARPPDFGRSTFLREIAEARAAAAAAAASEGRHAAAAAGTAASPGDGADFHTPPPARSRGAEAAPAEHAAADADNAATTAVTLDEQFRCTTTAASESGNPACTPSPAGWDSAAEQRNQGRGAETPRPSAEASDTGHGAETAEACGAPGAAPAFAGAEEGPSGKHDADGEPSPLLPPPLRAEVLVASGGRDQRALVWDASTGFPIRALEGHSDAVNAVCFLAPEPAPPLPGRPAAAAAVRVATGSEDGTVRVWAAATGACLAVLRGHTEGVSAVVGLDSRTLVSASADCTLRVWDIPTEESSLTLEGHEGPVRCLVTVGRRRVASGGDDCDVLLWCCGDGGDGGAGSEEQEVGFVGGFSGHEGWVWALAGLSAGRLASGAATLVPSATLPSRTPSCALRSR